jgi:hypothetical protein
VAFAVRGDEDRNTTDDGQDQLGWPGWRSPIAASGDRNRDIVARTKADVLGALAVYGERGIATTSPSSPT